MRTRRKNKKKFKNTCYNITGGAYMVKKDLGKGMVNDMGQDSE